MIFCIWVVVWLSWSVTPPMLAIPALAIVARAALLGRPMFSSNRVAAISTMLVVPTIVVTVESHWGPGISKGVFDGLRICIGAMCMNQAVAGLVRMDVRGWNRYRLGYLGVLFVIFDRSVDIHSRNLAMVFKVVRSRQRACAGTRQWATIGYRGAVAMMNEVIRAIDRVQLLLRDLPGTRDLEIWAVSGSGRVFRPVADTSLAALSLAGLKLGLSSGVPPEIAVFLPSF